MKGTILTLALLVLPSLCSACAVCSDGEKQNAMAFFWTTILLTALPLTLFGLLVRWVQKKNRELDAETAYEKRESEG